MEDVTGIKKMSSNKIFSQEKFKRQFFAASITMAVVFLMSLSDTLIAGRVLGEKAIVGLNLVMPLISIFAFISMMIGTGTAYRFSYEVGAFNKERANKYVGQGVILASLASFLMLALSWSGEEFFYSFVKTSDDIMQYTKSYYSWFPLIAASYPLFVLLQDLVYADGGIKTCTVANIVQMLGNIGISIVCCYFFGIAGISFGTFIGNLLAIVILSAYFFRKKSTLQVILHFSIKDTIEVLKLSFVHSSTYLYWGLTNIILNKLFLASFGEKYFPVLAVMYGITGLTMIFDGVAQAAEPICNIYLGENNTDGIQKIMSFAVKVSVIEGIVAMILLLVLGSKVAAMYNITSTDLLKMADISVRIYAPAMVFFPILYLFEMYYLIIGHMALSVAITLFKNFLLPVSLSMLLIRFFDIDGMWLGFLFAPILTLAFFSLFIFLRHSDSFPLLLKKEDIISADSFLTQEKVFELQNWIERECNKRKLDNKARLRAMLLIEEVGMQILEKNGENPVLTEVTAFFDNGLKIIFRDNGIKFNITNADEYLNFRGLVISGFLSNINSFGYLITGNYNRNVFTIV